MSTENTINVHGIGDIDDQTLELYFESKRHDGGEIQDIVINRNTGVARITFEDAQVADRMLAKRQISIDGQDLTIRRPPEYDPFSVLVIDLTPDMSRDSLELFFESFRHSGGGAINNMLYEDGSRWAKITFVSSEDAQRVIKTTKPIVFNKKQLQVLPCPRVSMVQVYDVSGISEQTVGLYFENSRRSSGGPVSTFEVKNGVAIIQFEEYEVADQVLQKSHQLSNRDLTVEPYFPEIGPKQLTPSLSHDPPDPFTIKLDHSLVYSFLTNNPDSSDWADKLEKKMNMHLSCVKNDLLEVTYVPNGVDERSKDAWTELAKGEISQYLKKIKVIRLPVSGNQETVQAECEKQKTESTIVDIDHSANQIVIVGYEDKVLDVSMKMKTFLNDLKESNAILENEIQLSPGQLRLFVASNHASYMKERAPGLEVIVQPNGVLLKGNAKNLQRGFSLVFDDFQCSTVQQEFSMIGTVYSGLKEKTLFDTVQSKLDAEKLLVSLDVNIPDDLLIINAFSYPDVDACKNQINLCLCYKQVPVPSVSSAECQRIIDDLETAFRGSINISVEHGQVHMICLPSDLPAVEDRIKVFKTEEESMRFSLPVVYIFTTFYQNKLQDIIAEINQTLGIDSTKIMTCDPEVHELRICGTRDAIKLARSRLMALKSQVQQDDLDISAVSMPKFFLSEEGCRFLMSVGDTHKCVCVVDQDMDPLLNSMKNRNVSASRQASSGSESVTVITLKSGFVIKIMPADLRKSKVDTIIIPANTKLQHTLHSVRALVDSGGPAIMTSCLDQLKLRVRQEYPLGSTCETESGSLSCKRLLHVCMVNGDLMQTDDMIVQEGISSCIEDYIKYKDVQSIAFMVLEGASSRQNLLPKAQSIAGALIMCLVCDPDHSIKEVHLVSQDAVVNDVMQETLVKIIQEFGLETENVSNGPLEDDIEGAVGGAVGGAEGGADENTIEEAAASVTISIYGLDRNNMKSVSDEIKSKCDDMCQTVVLESVSDQTNIKSLCSSKECDIKKLPEKYDHEVKIEIVRSRQQNTIQLSGRASSVMKCKSDIYEIFSREELFERLGAVGGDPNSREKFHWEKKPKGGSFEPYRADVSGLLEIAYRDDPTMSAQYQGLDGRYYTVNFNTMQEYARNDQSTSIAVRRAMGELLSDTLDDLPSHWTDMLFTECVLSIELDKNTEEYNEVLADFKNSMGSDSKKIIKIERIQNPVLYRQYRVKKMNMDKLNEYGTTNQRKLYHGTDGETVPKINLNGFNRSYCGKNATVIGKGVYFARDAHYSANLIYSPRNSNGHRHIYQCLVLTGEYTKGQRDFIDAPPKNPSIPAVLFDCVVDDKQNPSVFVIFHDTQAYPEYLITFRD